LAEGGAHVRAFESALGGADLDEPGGVDKYPRLSYGYL
jgi:hypothetical protein